MKNINQYISANDVKYNFLDSVYNKAFFSTILRFIGGLESKEKYVEELFFSQKLFKKLVCVFIFRDLLSFFPVWHYDGQS